MTQNGWLASCGPGGDERSDTRSGSSRLKSSRGGCGCAAVLGVKRSGRRRSIESRVNQTSKSSAPTATLKCRHNSRRRQECPWPKIGVGQFVRGDDPFDRSQRVLKLARYCEKYQIVSLLRPVKRAS